MSETKILASCDEYDPNSLNVDQARERILQSVATINGVERLALRSALGRVLAEDVISTIDVPAYTNSAMDGYAVLSSDLPTDGSTTLVVVGTAFAGTPLHQTLSIGQCARIMTGAKMPDGADTVIMQEHVEREGDVITLTAGHKAGQNVRQAGEDLARGGLVFNAGKQLTPADIGMIASMGMAEVNVHRKVRVAFFSTGDELRSIGETLGDGQIYDSNRYTLYGMLTRLGVELIDMGVIPDRREAIEAAFNTAASLADALITSGGVSVGEADYVKETLEKIGKVNFWKIAMKPGRPLAFGQVANCHFFGLPGNPVSAMVTFYQFVQPALQRMMGLPTVEPLTLQLTCVSDLRKAPGRVEFQRGIMETDNTGRLVVRSTGKQGSGMLSSMGKANCFIILPMDTAKVEAGSVVTVQPFVGLI